MLLVPTRRKYHQFYTPAQNMPMAWWDPSDEETIAESGGSVSQIDDLTGNAYHLTQGTGANRPVTGTEAINGLNVLDYGGSHFLENSSLGTALGGTNTPHAFYCVFELDDVSSTHVLYSAYGSGTQHYWFTNTTPSYRISRKADDTTEQNITVSTPPTATPVLAVVFFDGTTCYYYVNGVLFSTRSFNVGACTFDSFELGAILGGSGMNGKIAECFVTDASESTNVRQRNEGYLAHKFGISLTATHPYANYRPLVG